MRRGLRAACARSSTSCASDGPDRGRGRARPRLRRRRPGDRLREHGRGRALCRPAEIVYGEDADPDTTIELLDNVTFSEVREVAAAIADELSVAVVGPHTLEELETA